MAVNRAVYSHAHPQSSDSRNFGAARIRRCVKKQGHFLGNGPENDVRKAIFPAEIQIAYNCRDRHFNYEGAAGECRFVSYGLVK